VVTCCGEMAHVISWFIVLGIIVTVNAKPTCIGENGDAVDMFIIYKLPRLKGYTAPYVSKGKGYIYMDSTSPQFRLGSKPITDENTAVGRTLNQVYNSYTNEEMAYAFYNDQNPEGRSFSSSGHCKGALAFDNNSGFWLIHSVPKFPSYAEDGYAYPSSGLRYGQMMMCVTFNSDQFEEIAKQLIFNHPHIHDKSFPDEFGSKYPNMEKLLIHNKMVRRAPFSRLINLNSSAGTTYIDFAKDNQYRKDLYRDFVAVALKTNLLTETWQHGTDIGSSCKKKYHVEDISNINITINKVSIPFDSINDHSKFAIGKAKENPIVCVGDINRQPSQFKRGGGTLCFKNIDIWKQFYSLVDDIKGCPCAFKEAKIHDAL